MKKVIIDTLKTSLITGACFYLLFELLDSVYSKTYFSLAKQFLSLELSNSVPLAIIILIGCVFVGSIISGLND